MDFLSVRTVVLCIAGLSLGKDLPVGQVAFIASFLLSVLIAEFALGYWV